MLFFKKKGDRDIYIKSLDSGPKVIKLFSCSTQLSMKFQLLIKTKIQTNEEVSCFKSLRCCIYHADNFKMPTIVGLLTFMSTVNVLKFRTL